MYNPGYIMTRINFKTDNSIMKIFLPFLFLFFCSNTNAQTMIWAQIISSEKKEAIPFATISYNNDLIGTQSDLNGWFSLSCSPKEMVSIRCVGYKQKSIIASEITDRKPIELNSDTIMVEEITIRAESAYQLLAEAMDSTYKHQMKSFKGICSRQDKLSWNKTIKRESDARILFIAKNVNNEQSNVDYWLGDLKTASFGKISEQPYLAYPNTIPLNLFTAKLPSKEELSGIKCYLSTNTDNQKTIKVIRAKPTKNLINQANYFINKKTGIIEGFEYLGDFKGNPIKKSNRFHYQTKIKVTYNTIGDSCILDNFHYQMTFSHKKADPSSLWEYLVNMEITVDKNRTQVPQGKKLQRMDYLLFRDGDKNIR